MTIYGTQDLNPVRSQIILSSSEKDFSISLESRDKPNGNFEFGIEEWSISNPDLNRQLAVAMFYQAVNTVINPQTTEVIIVREKEISPITMPEFKRREAIQLIDLWLADESGHDEKVWEDIKETIEDNRLSYRKRFNE